MRIGIVGATGQVGGVMRRVLAEREFPVSGAAAVRVGAVGRADAAVGRCRGEVAVEDAATADYSGLDIVLFSAGGATSRALAEKVAGPGRGRDRQLLRLARATPRCRWWSPRSTRTPSPNRPKGIIANPNCTTMAAMPVLRPLHDEAGLTAMVATTYQAVSGSGLSGVAELHGQARKVAEAADRLTFDGEAVAFPEPAVYARPIAFNVVPLAGYDRRRRQLRDRRGAEAPQRVPQDPGDPGPQGLRHLRPGTGLLRSLPADQRPVRAARSASSGPTSCWPRRPASSCPRSRRRSRPRAGTRPTWAGSATTRRSRTASRSSCPTTTCARAPRSTPYRSRSWSRPSSPANAAV